MADPLLLITANFLPLPPINTWITDSSGREIPQESASGPDAINPALTPWVEFQPGTPDSANTVKTARQNSLDPNSPFPIRYVVSTYWDGFEGSVHGMPTHVRLNGTVIRQLSIPTITPDGFNVSLYNTGIEGVRKIDITGSSYPFASFVDVVLSIEPPPSALPSELIKVEVFTGVSSEFWTNFINCYETYTPAPP